MKTNETAEGSKETNDKTVNDKTVEDTGSNTAKGVDDKKTKDSTPSAQDMVKKFIEQNKGKINDYSALFNTGSKANSNSQPFGSNDLSSLLASALAAKAYQTKK